MRNVNPQTTNLAQVYNAPNPHKDHLVNPIPKNYAAANWTLMKAREDNVELPYASLMRFNVGRPSPWPVSINMHQQCVLHSPHNQYYCPQCGPDVYNAGAYKLNF